MTPVTDATPSTQAAPEATAPENRAVNDHLRALATVFGIPDAERVDGLVNQDPQPRVGRLLLVNDDPPGLLIAPTARLSRGRLERDCEPERLGERLHRSEQMSMGVAGQRLTGWFQGRGLDTLQRRDLGAIEHRDGFEQQPRLGVLV